MRNAASGIISSLELADPNQFLPTFWLQNHLELEHVVAFCKGKN
jgi:hypothetical protein